MALIAFVGMVIMERQIEAALEDGIEGQRCLDVKSALWVRSSLWQDMLPRKWGEEVLVSCSDDMV
jgi:hypothetical protein